MSDQPIPLRTLLADMRQGLDAAAAATKRDRQPDSQIDAAWTPWVRDAACEKLDEALNGDLIDLLVQGWSKAAELRGYAKDRYPPDKTVVMTLAEAKGSITVDPQLTLVVAELRCPLPITVEFLGTLHTGALTIKAGEITAVGLGRIELDAKLKWHDCEVPLGLKAREIELSGARTLKRPIPIPH
jgi:hypothetical protein